jgi:alpha-D-ribose 1-methylphosphonate 5-triphosphate synthase subunit PhnG
MALRRRIGISTATTEAARRQLMQPVPCWEKVWIVPEKAAPGSTLKVLKWVKTDKVQVRPRLGGVYAHFNVNNATVTAIQRRRRGCQ